MASKRAILSSGSEDEPDQSKKARIDGPLMCDLCQRTPEDLLWE